MTSPFQLRERKVVYRDAVLGLRLDTVELGPTQTVTRRVVEYKPACAVVATDALTNRVLLVRQYRHPIGHYLWDLPGGMIGEGESAEDCAVRELREETGFAVDDLEPLVAFHPEPAFTDHHIELFSGIVHRGAADDVSGEAEVDRSDWFEPEAALAMISSGDISSSWTVIGLLMSRHLRAEAV